MSRKTLCPHGRKTITIDNGTQTGNGPLLVTERGVVIHTDDRSRCSALEEEA